MLPFGSAERTGPAPKSQQTIAAQRLAAAVRGDVVARGCGARLLGEALHADGALTGDCALHKVPEPAQLAKDSMDCHSGLGIFHGVLGVPQALALHQVQHRVACVVQCSQLVWRGELAQDLLQKLPDHLVLLTACCDYGGAVGSAGNSRRGHLS